jgi:hypothetical protein
LIFVSFARRIRHAHFSSDANLMSFFGLPLFSWLLLRSWRRAREGGAVTWKGRTYAYSVTERAPNSSISEGSKVDS